MRIIPPTAFTTMPWRNGGGVTHEILKHERNGQLLWRLSIAEVASDGPFSLFPGLSRILTVFYGNGLVLTAPDRTLQARPLAPLAFSGDWPIDSRCINGHVRDFNVIFDARHILAEVKVHETDVHVELLHQPARMNAMMCVGGGEANGFDIAPGSFVLAGGEDVEVFCKAPALQVTLRELG